jgi:outer membrane protein assembly factor BamD (BamD/ComL family)
MMRRMLNTIVAAVVLACGLAGAAHAAPPGWELRNGAWVPIVPPSAGTPEGQVAQMMVDLDEGRPGETIAAAKEWLKANPTHPLAPQVLLLQGDGDVAEGNRYRALFSYEDLLNNYPTSELYVAVLQREYDLADSFLRGYKRLFLGLRILPVTDDAIELLYRIQDRQRGSPLAERAQMRIADYHFMNGDFQEAVDSYGDFYKRYPYSQYIRKAEVKRAEASLASFRGVLFDMTPLLDARERLSAIQEIYPRTAEGIQVGAIDDRIFQLEGAKELEIARYYWRASRKHAALYYYRRVVANWPGTLHAEAALRELKARFPRESVE